MALPFHDVNENTPLHDLAAAIRRYSRAIQDYTRNALRASMDLGDVLALARARVEPRRWKAWRLANCPQVSKRTDELYRQLAASRAIIERALESDPDMGIRDAVKLISTPKPRAPKPKPEELQNWGKLTNEEKRAGLAKDGVGVLLQNLPDEMREELANRLQRVRNKASKDHELTALFRKYVEKNPTDPIGKFVHDQAINRRRVAVYVDRDDAPSLRRPPLATTTTTSASMH
jgi:hypothetical protein